MFWHAFEQRYLVTTKDILAHIKLSTALPRVWAQKLSPVVNEDVSLVGSGDDNLQNSGILETLWRIQREAVSIVVIGRSLENSLSLAELVAWGYLRA